MSQKLIDFGKESVEVYRDYEKSMKDAEVALSTTYGRNTKELSQVMDNLNTSATEWAATTIFHTNDVANAIGSSACRMGLSTDHVRNTGSDAACTGRKHGPFGSGGLHCEIDERGRTWI